MSELVLALVLAAALGGKPVPAQPDAQRQAGSRPPASTAKAQVAQNRYANPNAPRREPKPPAL
jgi:hypothetical protein